MSARAARGNPLVEPGARLVIAHRGASAEAPENTLEAFRLALERGADALELDVRLTAEGIPVVIHDADLRRTTGRAGLVSALTLAQLREADAGWTFTPDAGRTFPFRERGVRVPTLAQVLEATGDVPLLIELKTRREQDAVADLLRRHGAVDRCVVASADHEALRRFRAAPFLVGASGRDIASLFFGCSLGVPPRRVGYAAASVPLRWRGLLVPNTRVLARARALGFPVHVWTVDDAALARTLWDTGVAGIVTNDPGALVRQRDEG